MHHRHKRNMTIGVIVFLLAVIGLIYYVFSGAEQLPSAQAPVQEIKTASPLPPPPQYAPPPSAPDANEASIEITPSGIIPEIIEAPTGPLRIVVMSYVPNQTITITALGIKKEIPYAEETSIEFIATKGDFVIFSGNKRATLKIK